MTNEETERLERWLDKFRRAGVLYAEAAARYEMLDAMTRVIKSNEMRAAEERGVTAIAGQERDAYASDEYSKHLGRVYQAHIEAKVAQANLEALRLQFSGRQTINANERAEVRAYGAT